MKRFLSLLLVFALVLSFTAFAVDFTCLSSTVSNDATAVYVKEKTITLTFVYDVNAETLSSITIAQEGEPYTDFTAELGAANEVKITFESDLAYSTQYVIFYGDLKSSSGASVAGTKNSLTFTTESEPLVQVKNITLTKCVGSAVEERDDDFLIADDTTQGFKVSLINESAETVNIVCIIYANGIIKEILTVDATATEVVELGTCIDQSYAGGFAKIYIWDNVSNKTPFVGSTRFEIQ